MADLHRTIDAVWRIESARLIATLARMVRDIGLAEDLAQDALLAALEKWPASGIPDKPGAWLTAVAKNRAIDLLRRHQRLQQKLEEVGREEGALFEADFTENDAALDRDIDDEMLSLVFTACHPLLSLEARVALTLRVLCSLSTDEIARAYLLPEATIAQRIVRAKRTLTEARVPCEAPRGPELANRLGSVLEVIYLIFNEGYAATSGTDWTRPALCEEALRLGRIVAGLMPDTSEVHGLVALMEIQASRLPARTGPGGKPVLLLDQNRARWDHLLIRRGLAALERAELAAAGVRAVRLPARNSGYGAATVSREGPPPNQAIGPVALGPYALQAEIAACHARARTAAETDWIRIAALYDALAQSMPSPVVELNRAVAVAMAYGPEAGLEIVDGLLEDPMLKNYHLLPSVRGDLLARLNRLPEAAAEFERAAGLTRNNQEQALLLERAAAARSPAPALDKDFEQSS
ncbi:MAG: RNA polymerase sigma factor [Candidatus Sericytochromatia bacterium]